MAAVASLIAFSAIIAEFLIALFSMVVGLLLLYLLKSKVEEALVDKMTHKISEKACRRTIQVVGIIFTVVGLSMVGLSRIGYPELLGTGLSLAYSSAILTLVYVAFWRYYAKKLGGLAVHGE